MDRDAAWRHPRDVSWDARIQVPFSPETAASGIGDTSFLRACWYRTPLVLPAIAEGDRILLHFGAVDYDATVWIDGRCLGGHEGGYTPFTFDITGCSDQSPVELVVRAEDDPQDLAKPRGKQDWQVAPHSIWYPRTTGIWQSVWMEVVPRTAIQNLRWTANIERWEVGLECWLSGPGRDGLRLHTRLTVGDHLIADDTYSVVNGEVHRRIALSDPGIDDYRNELLWCPESPTLIHASVELWADRGQLVDTVASYTALRSVGTQRDRFVLNNRAYRQRLVLDQGYWPESGMTAPDDQALRRDVELAKAMGFNGVRKHQKLEDPRYLYWADVLGLLVWAEMPSAYRFTQQSVQRVTREWTAAIARDASHPCVVAWVPVNESWGVPNLPDNPARATLRARALSPDPHARSDAAGDWQRRMGKRGDGHHRHPRLRSGSGAAGAPLSRGRRAAATLQPRAPRRAAPRAGRGASLRAAYRSLGVRRYRPQHPDGRLGLYAGHDCRGVGRVVSATHVGARLHRPGEWLLLHAVRRHLSGNQWPARCLSAFEDPSRAT